MKLFKQNQIKMLLMKIDGLIEGEVINRPSYYVRSPYVSDVKFTDPNTIININAKAKENKSVEWRENAILAHSPSLGCCGLADAGAIILMTPTTSNTKPKNELGLKCDYTIYLSKIENDIYVGIHPKTAEKLVKSAIENNCITSLKNVKTLRPETSIYIKDKIDSRFDFTGIDENGVPFILEVKNVPLADYEDCDKKERTKMDFSDRPFDSKVAYFPDGYRKTTYDTVSPRALKHIEELTHLKKEEPRLRCIMCYVIQRTDVNRFQASKIDPQYREAFCEARKVGVEIITMVVKWTADGEAYFVRDDLPISC